MKLTWIGHSCFKVESGDYVIILDPYQDNSVAGLTPIREEADLVLCSHEHGDHNGRDTVTIRSPREAAIRVSEISTFHDDKEGTMRGLNTIHILDDGICRIAHLGDLGCHPTTEQLEQLKNLDAVLIPVGGFFTIDAKQAKTLIDEIQPRVTIPMHYRGESTGYDVISTVNDFTDLCDDVKVYDGSEIEITKESGKQTAVLQPRNQ